LDSDGSCLQSSCIRMMFLKMVRICCSFHSFYSRYISLTRLLCNLTSLRKGAYMYVHG
jgi:hypothetical protein